VELTKENWIVRGHTGISSKAIWAHFSIGDGTSSWGRSNPSDPADFLRCYWLLQLAPEWRGRIAEMAVYPGWGRLALAWDELEVMLLAEVPKACETGKYSDESGPKMYARMKELLKEAA
jgi:hypothetical protein